MSEWDAIITGEITCIHNIFFKCWYTVYCVINLSLFILLPTFPKIFGVFKLVNASEKNLMMNVMREYFVDQEKYSYLILLHLDAAICVQGISIMATETLFISLMEHICGIFKIARWTYKEKNTYESFICELYLAS